MRIYQYNRHGHHQNSDKLDAYIFFSPCRQLVSRKLNGFRDLVGANQLDKFLTLKAEKQ